MTLEEATSKFYNFAGVSIIAPKTLDLNREYKIVDTRDINFWIRRGYTIIKRGEQV
jgi:hypothetical protein